MSASFTQTLMLGTGRMTDAPAAPHDELAAAWNAQPWRDSPEEAFLNATALLGIASHAARANTRVRVCVPFSNSGGDGNNDSNSSGRGNNGSTDNAGNASAVCAPETLPAAGNQAADLLARMCAGHFRPLLKEWLQLCSARGLRAPAFALPALLDAAGAAKNATGERSLAAAVSGERGRWLAAQNPAWSWVLAPARVSADEAASSSGVWETGSDEDRIAWLRALRASDPKAARERLAAAWADETPEFRMEALDVLEAGLGAGDETLLEKALVERRGEIRKKARALISRLPESGFARRMRERASKFLFFKKGLFSKKLEVVPPDAFDPDWKKDGIEQKARPGAGVGEKDFWMRQIMMCVPPSYLSEMFGQTPEVIIKAAFETEWGDMFRMAWHHSLQLIDDTAVSCEWLKAYEKAIRGYAHEWSCANHAISTVFARWPHRLRWMMAEQFASHGNAILACEPHLEGEPPSRAGALTVLRETIPMLRAGVIGGCSADTADAVDMARRMPLELRDEIIRLLQDNAEKKLSDTAGLFVQALELRAAMHAAFSEKNDIPKS
jgi:hypothetical protein